VRALIDENLTLQQLDGRDWGDPQTAPTGMVARCLRLRRTPLRDFTLGDLRLLVGQKIGLETIVPRALQHLLSEPLVETEYYPGDLLSVLLLVDEAYWSDHSVELEQLVLIARLVTPTNDKVADEQQAFLAKYDHS
jgi:hypothetical protein